MGEESDIGVAEQLKSILDSLEEVNKIARREVDDECKGVCWSAWIETPTNISSTIVLQLPLRGPSASITGASCPPERVVAGYAMANVPGPRQFSPPQDCSDDCQCDMIVNLDVIDGSGRTLVPVWTDANWRVSSPSTAYCLSIVTVRWELRTTADLGICVR